MNDVSKEERINLHGQYLKALLHILTMSIRDFETVTLVVSLKGDPPIHLLETMSSVKEEKDPEVLKRHFGAVAIRLQQYFAQAKADEGKATEH